MSRGPIAKITLGNGSLQLAWIRPGRPPRADMAHRKEFAEWWFFTVASQIQLLTDGLYPRLTMLDPDPLRWTVTPGDCPPSTWPATRAMLDAEEGREDGLTDAP